MTMARHDRGLKLRSLDGHFEMAPFELQRQADGYWMWVECDFGEHQGGHWLAPDPAGAAPDAVHVTSSPYCWPSAVEAFAARDRWEAQQA